MSIHEECGVLGVIRPEPKPLASLVYYGLYALQHRGQESCGIVINDDGLFYSHKDLGLLSEVFDRERLSRFPSGTMAIGHVRYATTGGNLRCNCQPIEINHMKGKLSIAHNGNLSNAAVLREKLELDGAIFHTTSDTEVIAYLVTKERLSAPSIEEAVHRAMARMEGAYSLVLMSAAKLIAVRDPHGFRPLCYGKTADGGYVVASESSALRAVGIEPLRDLEPGEMLVFRNDAEVISDRRYCGTKPKKPCIFEYIYFARPDSILDGVSVHMARKCAGSILAKCAPVAADVVIGVPDSGLDAALGYAQTSGIPYAIGLIKNKYIGRTFIAPEQQERIDGVKIKLSPIASVLKGKRVVLVDDSIVRGTTAHQLVKLIRDAGASEVHMRITAPPFLHPCYYGTDIDSEENLIANQHTVEDIAEMIGVNTLAYLPIASLKELVEGSDYCAACFTGDYPTERPNDMDKNRFQRKLSERTE